MRISRAGHSGSDSRYGAVAPYYETLLPQLFSMECWGGATFDFAMRFLVKTLATAGVIQGEDAHLLLQMLFRSANAVGYTNYPDNGRAGFSSSARRQNGIDVVPHFSTR